MYRFICVRNRRARPMNKTRGAETALAPFLDEREQRINADHAWCVGEEEIRRKHGGKIAAVYNRTVLGAGRTYAAAWTAAQRSRACPPKHEVALEFVPCVLLAGASRAQYE